MMKLSFDPHLAYQLDAVRAITDLFDGQEVNRAEYSALGVEATASQLRMGLAHSEFGVGNRLLLTNDAVHENLRNVQKRNGLAVSDTLDTFDFSVEMETGTGKTYVYLRTLFELNARFGFSKFMIVVPSIAIREGTYKMLDIARDHLERLYPAARGYEYCLYDSSKLGRVQTFATSSNLHIMVLTVGAINKRETNSIYQLSEQTGGSSPVDLIRATRPIIVVDEPQSVDGGLTGEGRKALESMNALCTLRYSATHAHADHMVYRLDAFDAYEQGLVKRIEVAGLTVQNAENTPYVRLLSTHGSRRSVSAKAEVITSRGRRVVTLEDGDRLEQITDRPMYRGYLVSTIVAGKAGSLTIASPEGDVTLRRGEEVNGVDRDQLHRSMIRRTIATHLDKELEFARAGSGIKVLSLFFIDSVKFYRTINEDRCVVPGKYARMFEEEYQNAVSGPQYSGLPYSDFQSHPISDVHNGYFSMDRKKVWRDPDTTQSGKVKESQANRQSAERAYNLIMREKEKLLSMETPLRFIFSHSALREGWDNPNVFQICVLREMGSDQERRQSIGRGLRLCVDQRGERVFDRQANMLTVIAKESYEEFAAHLQHELAKESDRVFGQIKRDQFAHLQIVDASGAARQLGVDGSLEVWKHLRDAGYITNSGKVRRERLDEMNENGASLPFHLAEWRDGVTQLLLRLASGLDIQNADERVRVSVRRDVLDSPWFEALWSRVRQRTVYRVQFDAEELISQCADAIRKMPPIPRTRIRFETAQLDIDYHGVQAHQSGAEPGTIVTGNEVEVPDVLSVLQDAVKLTRRGIASILIESRRLEDLRRNPQEFIKRSIAAIERVKSLFLVDGIKYTKLGAGDIYAQELFEQEELAGYIRNSIEVTKSVFDRVIFDSVGVEKRFAQDLELNSQVKVFTKLPAWFSIPTPLGSYNPDWAILIESEGMECLYFVVETKGSNWEESLRPIEEAKIACGERHFEAIAEGEENPAKFVVASKVADLFDHE